MKCMSWDDRRQRLALACGPSKSIEFDRAAVYWGSLYHLMLRDEARFMNRARLKKHTASLQDLFGVHMRYFAKSKSAARGFKEVRLLGYQRHIASPHLLTRKSIGRPR
jgi:hypothetical protein